MVVNERVDRFEVLYRENYRAIFAYVYRRLGQHTSEVSDVVADVFVVAWRRLDEVPGGREGRLWLYGVARRCVRNAQRSARRRLGLLRHLTAEVRLRADDVGDGLGRQDVRTAIDRLRPLDREVVRLVMWEGLSHAEAATVLNCSTNAVAQRLHTARQRLRAELDVAPARVLDLTARE